MSLRTSKLEIHLDAESQWHFTFVQTLEHTASRIYLNCALNSPQQLANEKDILALPILGSKMIADACENLLESWYKPHSNSVTLYRHSWCRT